MQVTMLLGPLDPADPIALKMSVANSNAVWSFWKPPKGESECRPLRFWSRFLLSFMDNNFLFEKQIWLAGGRP